MRPSYLDQRREAPREEHDALTADGHDDPVSLLQGAVNDRNAALQVAREAGDKVAAAVADALAARADVETMAHGREAAEVERAAALLAHDQMAERLAEAHEQGLKKDDEIAKLSDELKLAHEELASLKEKKDESDKKPGESSSD